MSVNNEKVMKGYTKMFGEMFKFFKSGGVTAMTEMYEKGVDSAMLMQPVNTFWDLVRAETTQNAVQSMTAMFDSLGSTEGTNAVGLISGIINAVIEASQSLQGLLNAMEETFPKVGGWAEQFREDLKLLFALSVDDWTEIWTAVFGLMKDGAEAAIQASPSQGVSESDTPWWTAFQNYLRDQWGG